MLKCINNIKNQKNYKIKSNYLQIGLLIYKQYVNKRDY